MKLRSNLGFLGDNNDGIISVQMPGTEGQVLEFKPTNYKEFISFLEDLNCPDKVKEKILSDNEKEYLSFLKHHNLVYDNFNITNEKNPRLLNFVNNFTDSTDRYSFLDRTKNKTAVIIGLGTLGTAILHYLIQIGITNFVLIDGDTVESKNLYHQRYYTKDNIGKSKVNSLKNELANNELNITVRSDYLSDKKQLDSLLNGKNKKDVYVFCAFDNLNGQLLKMVHKIHTDYITYIAGYNRKLVFATSVSNSFLEDYKNEVENYDIVKDNSGMGFLGDLTALLMLRLWIQQIIPELNYGWDYLEYSLFDDESSIFSHYIVNDKIPNTTDKDFLFKYGLDSLLNNLYSKYLLTNNENNLADIKAIGDKYNIDIEETSNYATDYKSRRNDLHIEYLDKKVNISDFYNTIMPNITMSSELGEQLDNCLKTLESDTLTLINQKKNSVHTNYTNQLNNLENQLPCLTTLVRKINSTFFTNKELDFLKYDPQISDYKFISLSDQLKQVSLVDNLIPGYSLTQHIEFMNNHNFLKVSKQYNMSLTSFDERYNVSTSFVKQEDNLWGLLTLGHEIGHNYFNSFIVNPITKTNMSTLMAEILAFINESLLTRQLMKSQKNLVHDFLFYIYRLISVPFSMDLYQKNIFAIDNTNLSWQQVIERRINTITSLFPDKKISNLKYSNHNIAMNDEFLFNETELFLYPKAYVIGFFISTSFINEPHLYIKFIKYISEQSNLDIVSILKKVFDISEDKAVEEGTRLLQEFISDISK